MEEDKNAPAKAEKVNTNPLKLPWPQDRAGITAQLQREGCRSIGRMMGDDEAYELVVEVLRVLARHAAAKLEEQKAEKTAIRVAGLERRRAKFAAQTKDRSIAIKKIDTQIDKLSGRKEKLEKEEVQAQAAVTPVAPVAPVAPVVPAPVAPVAPVVPAPASAAVPE